MRDFMMGLGAGVIVAGVVGALVIAFNGDDESVASGPPAPAQDATQLAEVLARLDAVDGTLASIGRRVDSAARSQAQRDVADPVDDASHASPPELIAVLERIDERLTSLESACSQMPEIAQRVAAVETGQDEAAARAVALSTGAESPFAKVETPSLLSRAKILSKDAEQALLAVQAYEELLSRNLTDEQRRQALGDVGSLYFTAKDYVSAARSFQGAVDLMEPRSKDTLGRLISLGHSLLRSQDREGAIEVFGRVLAHPHGTNVSDANAYSTISACWSHLGDREQARRALQTMIERFGSETGSVIRQYVANATQRLTRL